MPSQKDCAVSGAITAVSGQLLRRDFYYHLVASQERQRPWWVNLWLHQTTCEAWPLWGAIVQNRQHKEL